MYFVDRKLLEDRLVYIEQLVHFLREMDRPESQMARLACERAIHVLIDAILDVGNQMIDGFIMKDPGSYEDIVRVLEDEQVLLSEEADKLVELISCRKVLVQAYTQVDMQQIWRQYQQAAQAVETFPERIRTYLKEHLGPVNAFGSEGKDGDH